MTTNGGSMTLRNIPDVALTADNIWVIYNNGTNALFGGTSVRRRCGLALPPWSTSRRRRSANLRSVLSIWRSMPLAREWIIPRTFTISPLATTRIATAEINFSRSGYDLCTGWGTPNGANLINALASPDPLQITRAAPFTASGAAGGPFSPTNQSFSLTMRAPLRSTGHW